MPRNVQYLFTSWEAWGWLMGQPIAKASCSCWIICSRKTGRVSLRGQVVNDSGQGFCDEPQVAGQSFRIT